ncbi:MAG: hypothetical protein OEU36_08970 [Gammaproteobacteria bacterium]|nr:hypothetical protein [Gammaproteobacteria bacterium]
MKRVTTLLILLLFTPIAQGAVLEGALENIIDGDTISMQSNTVRLEDIDMAKYSHRCKDYSIRLYAPWRRITKVESSFNMSTHSLPSAVVLGGWVTGLWTARALAQEGIRVAVVHTHSDDFAGSSRHVARTIRLRPAPVNPAQLAERLLSQGGGFTGGILIPTSDFALEALSRFRDDLSCKFRVHVPAWEIVRRFLDKSETATLAREVGVPRPTTFGLIGAGASDAVDAPVPFVVKPLDSRRFSQAFGRKLWIVKCPEKLRRCVEKLRMAGLKASVEALIPGGDDKSYNYTAYVDTNGQVKAEFLIHKLRKYPPRYGIGSVITPLLDKATATRLSEATLAMVRRVGYFGLVSAEFKQDARDGRLLLMEINARCSFVQQLAWKHGVNYPALLYREAAFGEVPYLRATPGPQVLIHLKNDLLGALFFRASEGLTWKEYLGPYRYDNKCYAVWCWRDPWPFFVEWSHMTGLVLRRARMLGRRSGNSWRA